MVVVALRAAVDVDCGAGGRRQAAVAADVVGVVMGLHYVFDPHAGVMRECEVLLDVELRVDDRDAGVLVTDHIRPAAQIVVDNLAESCWHPRRWRCAACRW